MREGKNSSKMEVYNNKGLSQEKNFSLTLCLKELGKEEQTKLKVSRRNEIIKIRVGINEIKTKK